VTRERSEEVEGATREVPGRAGPQPRLGVLGGRGS
jgi:hypothetical protein